MNKETRREAIKMELMKANEPISGEKLANLFHVSRQVIVQDIALLRANNMVIYSTNRGYIMQKDAKCFRVFKVCHTGKQAEEELKLIIDLGGKVEDIFVYHKVYGVMKAQLHIHSRRDIKRYLESIASGKSEFLGNVTSGYHYHTISADSEEILDVIWEQLLEKGFVAKLQDYEPVDFWKNEK